MLSRLATSTFALPVLAVAILLAACGGDSGGSNSGSGLPAGQVTPVDQVPAGAAEIDQSDLAFKPDKVTVKVGQVLYFKNSEPTLHTVTIEGKNVSGTMKKGSILAWTAPAAGTYKVTCDYHPQMHATVTVQ
jgi:plastocyanin